MTVDKTGRISMLWPPELVEKVNEILERISEATGHPINRTEFVLEAVRYYLGYLASHETDKAIESLILDARKNK